MKINTKIRYSMRMIVCLANAGKMMNTTDLGEQIKVSPKYLRKLAGPLEKADILASTQGIHGGYTLARAPAKISMKMIWDAYQETINIAACVSNHNCGMLKDCLARPVWERLEKILVDELDRTTIQDIIDRKCI